MKLPIFGLMGLILTSALAVHAASLPAGYPGAFQRSGVIDELPGEGSKSIVISDVRYLVGPGLIVHSPQLSRATMTALHVKQRIGFSLTGQGPGVKGTVTEVWILPKDYKP